MLTNPQNSIPGQSGGSWDILSIDMINGVGQVLINCWKSPEHPQKEAGFLRNLHDGGGV